MFNIPLIIISLSSLTAQESNKEKLSEIQKRKPTAMHQKWTIIGQGSKESH